MTVPCKKIFKISNLLLNAHRFYLFLCSVCNDGNKEKLMRLSQELTIEDIAHLALYSLTLETGKKYHDLDKSILPFLEKTWKDFEPSNKVFCLTSSLSLLIQYQVMNVLQLVSMTPIALRKKIVSVFWQNKNRYFSCFSFVSRDALFVFVIIIRFMCGRELKKKQTMWGLRNRLPPPLPTVLTPQTIRTLQMWSNSKAVSLTPWNKYGF